MTEPVGPHRATVVWLHGIGQVPGDLAEVADRLRLDRAGVRGVFPRAPVTAPSLLTGLPVSCWFPQSVLALDRIDVEGLAAVLTPLTALLTAETARVGAARTLVAGFSQGATVALTLALGHPERLAGTALYAPYLPPDLPALLPGGGPAPANERLPVWIGHGARDWVVPERSGEGLRDLLASWGHPVTWQRYPGGHEPFAGVRASLPDFLGSVLGTPVPHVGGPGPTARAS
ncbi:alpha/beta hydrolase [Streptomyces sp. NPDC090306]|uniref:alpha/beta hydrolase n=1 Tax=Streptomyces sp. NPDC090306 TaxID=3365961 RepID=UPI0037F8692E